jgi:predicted small metal-binding protein
MPGTGTPVAGGDGLTLADNDNHKPDAENVMSPIIESFRAAHSIKMECPDFKDSIHRSTTTGVRKDFYDEVEEEVFLHIKNKGGETEALKAKHVLKHLQKSLRKKKTLK